MTLFRHMNCVVVLLIWGILIYPLVCVDGFAVNRWAPMRFKLRSTAETSVPPEIARCSAANDLILVERLSAPLATSEGLYIPSVEGKDDKRLGRVLSVPEGQFAVSEKALIPTAKAAPYSIGDIVFIRDAWGIGPLHIQLGKRYFSFHKLDHILGKVTTQGK